MAKRRKRGGIRKSRERKIVQSDYRASKAQAFKEYPALGRRPLSPTEASDVAEVRALRSQTKALRKSHIKDVRSTRGAARMLTRGLNQAMRDIDKTGLTGVEKAQTLKEFISRRIDVLAGAELQQNVLRDEFREARSELGSEFAQARARKRAIFQNIAFEQKETKAKRAAAIEKAKNERKSDTIKAKEDRRQDYRTRQRQRKDEQRQARERKQDGSGGDDSGLTPTQRRALRDRRRIAMGFVRSALKHATKEERRQIFKEPWAFGIAGEKEVSTARSDDIVWALGSIKNRQRKRAKKRTRAARGFAKQHGYLGWGG